MDNKQKLKDIIINYEIVFWKWLNNSTIGLVTTTSVLLLSIDDVNSPAKKVFARQGPLATPNVFIMNLLCDPLLQWYTLSAVTSTKNKEKQQEGEGILDMNMFMSNQLMVYGQQPPTMGGMPNPTMFGAGMGGTGMGY